MTAAVSTIRVLIADDEALVRAGIAAILGADPDIEVAAEAGNGADALTIARTTRLDALVLDIRMPGMSGLDVLRTLRSERCETPCLFVTTFGEDAYVAEALDVDADGFVLKSGDPRELIFGVRVVVGGGAFFSPAIARRILPRHLGASTSRTLDAKQAFASLSPREQDILRLVGRGLSNAEIAADLFLAQGTVKTHVSSILRRTAARNRVEAALIAVHAHEA